MGLQNTLNFRIQGHKMKLVEVEGTHSVQNTYDSLDVHVGQSYSVLVTADQMPQDYYIVVSTRFTAKVLTTTGVLRYKGSTRPVSGPIPAAPGGGYGWSINQARSFRYFLLCTHHLVTSYLLAKLLLIYLSILEPVWIRIQTIFYCSKKV